MTYVRIIYVHICILCSERVIFVGFIGRIIELRPSSSIECYNMFASDRLRLFKSSQQRIAVIRIASGFIETFPLVN